MDVKAYRQEKGQALAEGTAFMVILIPVMVALVLLVLYISIRSYYQLMLAQVADAAARSAVHDKYWLGAQRPDYDPAQTTADVQTTATNLWKRIGLPGYVNASVDLTNANMVAVTVSASGLPIPSVPSSPPGLALQATAAEPWDIDRPIGVLGFASFKLGSGGQGICLPTYGAGQADGIYGPATPGPTSYPFSPAPYWYTSVLSTTNGPPVSAAPPIAGPGVNANTSIPFPGY